MAVLKFAMKQFKELVAITESATEHRSMYGDEPRPAIFLVKDEGVYLMSSRKLPDGEMPMVVYASGYDPKTLDRSELWDKCRAACGGDDFAEAFGLDQVSKYAKMPDDWKWFKIGLNKKTISITVA